jgi:hypothetical protein
MRTLSNASTILLTYALVEEDQMRQLVIKIGIIFIFCNFSPFTRSIPQCDIGDGVGTIHAELNKLSLDGFVFIKT